MTQLEAKPDWTASSEWKPAKDVDEAWVLSSHEPQIEQLYLANGYIGTSLDFAGGMLFESESPACYIRGVYTSGEDAIDRLAMIPSWNRFRYGHPSSIQRYVRRLDLRRGILRTEMTLREERGEVQLNEETLLSRADRHQAAVQLTVRSSFDGEITLLAGMEALAGGDATVEYISADEDLLLMQTRVAPYGIEVAQGLRFEHTGATVVAARRPNAVNASLTFSACAGEQLTVTQLARVATTLESPHPRELVQQEENRTYAQIRSQHVEAWERLWQTDIEVDGDLEAQQFARAALFYLWSTVREGDDWSIAPMGLSGNFYNGHIFWDAELWMYPSLLVTQPELGKSCTSYRERTLGPARDRAAQSGHSGAQFPWEGGYTGEEMTPRWAETRDFQLHITADVAIAQWWYYLVTGDGEWLRDHGFPVIKECAEYWVSRVEHNVVADRYEVSDVVCADEYAEHVNNDAFTNASVRKALQIAVRAAELLDAPAPKEWGVIADRMYIPYDGENGRHLEFDGYDGRVTKQADVELLAYPLEHTTEADQIQRDLDYYGKVIDPDGPAMSFSVYSILSAQLGRAQEGYAFLRKSFMPNTTQPFWSFSETPSNNKFFFCTGVGGSLQAFLFGFSGLRLREDHIVIGPILPAHWRSLRLRGLFVQGDRTDFEFEPQRTVVRRHLVEGTVCADIDHETQEATFFWTGGPAALQVEWVDDQGSPVEAVRVVRGERVRLSLDQQSNVRMRLCSDVGATLLDLAIRLQADPR